MPVPLMVRNTEKGPTVLSDLRTKEYVEWAGAGDPMGNDVQAVPDEFGSNVNFMRAVQRGILVIENEDENPEIADAIAKQNASWAARRDQAQKQAEASIDQQANEDLITVDCALKGCTNVVSVKEKQKDNVPPLCSTHVSLAHEFVPVDNVEGESRVRTWNRVTLGAREKTQN